MELSPLEMGAAVAGVVAAAAMLLLRRRKSSGASAPVDEAPAAAVAPRSEPVLVAEVPERAPEAPAATALVAEPLPPAAEDAVLVSRPVRLNPLIDCIVEMQLEAPLPGARLLELTRRHRRIEAKPIAYEGQDAASGDWEPLVAANRYRALRAGLLLANRAGPVDALAFSSFAGTLQPLSEPLGALVDLPDMAPVIQRARELDASCAELDAQIGLSIETPQPADADVLAEAAGTCGLVRRDALRWVREQDGAELYTMSLDPAGRVLLLLDVPRAPAAAQPWRQMLDCAVQGAALLRGQIVDDTGRRVDLGSLERIEGELQTKWIALERAGFPAGSPEALRLFS